MPRATFERDLFQIQATGNRGIISPGDVNLQVCVQQAASNRRQGLTSRQRHPGTDLMDAQTIDSEPQRDRILSFACLRDVPCLALREAQQEWLIERQRDDRATTLDNLEAQSI